MFLNDALPCTISPLSHAALLFKALNCYLIQMDANLTPSLSPPPLILHRGVKIQRANLLSTWACHDLPSCWLLNHFSVHQIPNCRKKKNMLFGTEQPERSQQPCLELGESQHSSHVSRGKGKFISTATALKQTDFFSAFRLCSTDLQPAC